MYPSCISLFIFVKENGKKERSCSNLYIVTLDGSTATPNGSGSHAARPKREELGRAQAWLVQAGEEEVGKVAVDGEVEFGPSGHGGHGIWNPKHPSYRGMRRLG
jgi:hypothetical protein